MNCVCSVSVCGPSGPNSDETDEDRMDTNSDDIEEEEEEVMVIDALAARMTIVFEGGHSGALPGYVLVARSHSASKDDSSRSESMD